MTKIALILSCEHAVNTVPEAYQELFNSFQFLLATHRGIDFGALSIAQEMQHMTSCILIQAKATRLLIDCNRSLHHANCFSEVTAPLSVEEKQQIINDYYLPFRNQVKTCIQKHIDQGMQVLHLSIHSFVPVLNDVERATQIGLLYDPGRKLEKKLARLWQSELKIQAPEYRVRFNYPYKGVSDGFTTSLRKLYPEEYYLGMEVESNQILVEDPVSLRALKQKLASSLLKILNIS